MREEAWVELHQLRYFECIARYESISRASSELHITQPALSKSIAKLEDELGVKLFSREGKRLALNDQGVFFLHTVEKVLRDLDDSAMSLVRLTAGLEGNVRVGVFGPQQDALACTVMFMQENPGVRVVFDARQSSASRHLMREYDVVFYSAGRAFDDISGISYAVNSLKIAVSPDHRLAGRESVSLEELKDDQFIFTNTTAGVYEQSYQLCIESGFYPAVRAVVTSGAAQIAMIRAGLGVGLVDGMMQVSGMPGIALLDMQVDLPDRMLCFASGPYDSLSPIARRFVDHTFAYFDIPLDDRAKARLSSN